MNDTTVMTWTAKSETDDGKSITMRWIRTADGRTLYEAEADGYVATGESVMRAQADLAFCMDN